MKRVLALIFLVALGVAWSTPAAASKGENRSIGENGREARQAAKHQKKVVKKNAKRQRKAMKKNQKAQRRAEKRQRHSKR
jgi:hypothetical protein